MRTNSTRRALALFGVATLAACLSFGFTVKSTNSANVQFTGATVNQVFPFDLSSSKDVQDHLSKLGSISINSATVTVESITDPPNNVTSISGSLSMLTADQPQDAGCTDGVFVGTISDFAITANNSVTVVVDAGSALDTYLANLLKLPDGGNGPLAGAAIICGTATGSGDGGVDGDFTLTLQVVYNINYDWP
jgi:hypothetical protein